MSEFFSIIQAPDNRLTTPCEPVTAFDDTLVTFADKLSMACKQANGAGLGANQIGGNKRVLVAAFLYGITPFLAMVNPEIIQTGKNQTADEEGCLSIDYGKKKFRIKRFDTITVVFADTSGKKHQLLLRGHNARVVQHEIDHLNGLLISRFEPVVA